MGKLLGVTLDGVPATWVTLLPYLLKIARKETLYRRAVWRCRCTTGTCAESPKGADLPGGEWSHCPYGLLRSVQFSVLVALDKCATIAPLAGWPEDYPAWLSWGLVLLHQQGNAK